MINPWKRGPPPVLGVILSLILLATVMVAVAEILSYRAIDRELTAATLSRRLAVADLAAVTISEKFDHLVSISISLATRVRFRQLVAAGQWAEAIEILRNVPRDLPMVERLFLTDAAGTLMADVPELPGVRGRSFADRDWYKGMSADGKPYVSSAYRRAAAPQANVFAVSVAIRTDGGDVSGILVLQVRLDTFFAWLKPIEMGPAGFVYVVDRKGQIAFHSKYPGRNEIVTLPAVPAVQQVLRGDRSVDVTFDPAEKEDSVSAYTPVSGYGWGLIVQQPARAAFTARSEQLARVLVAYSLVLLFCVLVVYLVFRIILQGRRAEQASREQNELLEQRVRARTAEWETANQQLHGEITERKQAEHKNRSQLEHLSLLDQITRSTGERLDLKSIFQIVLIRLEDSLPIDFGCVCLHDAAANTLRVSCVGAKSEALAHELTIDEQASINVDENGLARCVQGQLVYEPDIGETDFSFPQRLARGGLRSVVMAPLKSESRVFGVLVVARRAANGFTSAECEFLRQLSEHIALAAHQAQLYGSLQQAYDDLRQTQAAVMQAERLRALGQMASGIAHDINNALSPVSLYVESMLETERDLSARARGYLETIQRAVEDVAKTVARMREFYRQREQQIELAPVDVNQMAQQVLDLTKARWSDMAQRRGAVIRVETELAPDLPRIMGVEGEIREALTNLVFNAVDAMPEGGTLTLRTRLTGPDAERAVAMEVADSGIGMDEETRKRCLEPFFTTKGERGTGLGLAMVFGMVQRHSCGIEIDSAPGAGTTMRLVFDVPTAAMAEHVQPAAAPAAPKRLRLLLVDDDPVLLKSLCDALETDSHIIVTANGGEAGITAFRTSLERGETFAAVITDLGMPYVDGRQVAAAVKEASAATPVIMLTGWGQRMIADKEIPPHVDRVLAKPPKLREVREALALLCRPAATETSA